MSILRKEYPVLGQLKEAILGNQVSALFLGLTGNRVSGSNLRNGRGSIHGPINLAGFEEVGAHVQATVDGDCAALAVVRNHPEEFGFDGRIATHPFGLVGVQTGYFNRTGDSLGTLEINEGRMEGLAHLVKITTYRDRSQIELALGHEVARRARLLISDQIRDEMILEVVKL